MISVIGGIAPLTGGEDKVETPLSHEIDHFVKIVTAIAILTALIFFGISFPINDNNVSLATNFAIGVFVAWISKGLHATVTMYTLDCRCRENGERYTLVQELQSVETLGTITLSATNKKWYFDQKSDDHDQCLDLWYALRCFGWGFRQEGYGWVGKAYYRGDFSHCILQLSGEVRSD